MTLSKRQKRSLKKNGILDDRQHVPQRGMKIKTILPKTFVQQEAFDAFDKGDHLLLHGMAGTGKTFMAMYLALDEIFNNAANALNNVTIVRSAVATRDMGFMPGKEEDKMAGYEMPYQNIATELFGRGDAYDILKQKELVKFHSTSFVRGCTFNNTYVIIDEVNNMSFHELDSLITRLGDNCRVIFCGDFRQSDLTKAQERAGLKDFMKIIDTLNGFTHVEFTKHDIVRSALVKEYIIAREELGVCA